MSIDYHEVQTYLNTLVPQRPLEIQKMEAYAQKNRFPIVGPASAQFCYQIARLIGAKRIFELGSGYGYSTAWFAQAVQENGGGEVYHVVWDEDLSKKARQHLNALGLGHLIQYRVNEAVQTLRETDGPFDIIFNDIDKESYPASLPIIADKLRPGGVLIIDNMLLSGRIFDKSDTSPTTEGVRTFSQQITTDPQWICSLLPIRDGLIMAYKK